MKTALLTSLLLGLCAGELLAQSQTARKTAAPKAQSTQPAPAAQQSLTPFQPASTEAEPVVDEAASLTTAPAPAATASPTAVSPDQQPRQKPADPAAKPKPAAKTKP